MNDTLDSLNQAKEDLFDLFREVCWDKELKKYDTKGRPAFENAKFALVDYGLIENKDCVKYETD